MREFNIVNILINDAERCMDAYESGADKTESRLLLARVQLDIAYKRGTNIDPQLNRLINLYRVLGSESS